MIITISCRSWHGTPVVSDTGLIPNKHLSGRDERVATVGQFAREPPSPRHAGAIALTDRTPRLGVPVVVANIVCGANSPAETWNVNNGASRCVIWRLWMGHFSFSNRSAQSASAFFVPSAWASRDCTLPFSSSGHRSSISTADEESCRSGPAVDQVRRLVRPSFVVSSRFSARNLPLQGKEGLE